MPAVPEHAAQPLWPVPMPRRRRGRVRSACRLVPRHRHFGWSMNDERRVCGHLGRVLHPRPDRPSGADGARCRGRRRQPARRATDTCAGGRAATAWPMGLGSTRRVELTSGFNVLRRERRARPSRQRPTARATASRSWTRAHLGGGGAEARRAPTRSSSSCVSPRRWHRHDDARGSDATDVLATGSRSIVDVIGVSAEMHVLEQRVPRRAHGVSVPGVSWARALEAACDLPAGGVPTATTRHTFALVGVAWHMAQFCQSARCRRLTRWASSPIVPLPTRDGRRDATRDAARRRRPRAAGVHLEEPTWRAGVRQRAGGRRPRQHRRFRMVQPPGRCDLRQDDTDGLAARAADERDGAQLSAQATLVEHVFISLRARARSSSQAGPTGRGRCRQRSVRWLLLAG